MNREQATGLLADMVERAARSAGLALGGSAISYLVGEALVRMLAERPKSAGSGVSQEQVDDAALTIDPVIDRIAQATQARGPGPLEQGDLSALRAQGAFCKFRPWC